MGANLPIALAPGMGMNAYFTYVRSTYCLSSFHSDSRLFLSDTRSVLLFLLTQSVVGFRGTGDVAFDGTY